ncbi:MAG: PilZ domain-containing protein [Candidatus Acidiferrales bacterium]|jgi:hypothetical protein
MAAKKGDTITGGASIATGEEIAERRRWPRYAIMATARVIEPLSMAKVEGRCTDLGAGGCYVDSINSFPLGTKVRLSVWQGNRRFESLACVVYSLRGMGMGLVFTQMEPAERATIETWVRELSCGLESEPGHSELTTVPSAHAPQAPQSEASSERAVLMHLIDLLARKCYVTPQEAESLLRELFR